MNQKKTKRETVFLSPQTFDIFTQWGQAVMVVKLCDLTPGTIDSAPYYLVFPKTK